MSSELAASAYS